MKNIAIVGTGNISQTHISGLLELRERCKIVALTDIVPNKAEEKNERYGLQAKVFASHEQMLDSGLDIDLVHICTPPYVHASIAIDCMNRGVNVLVEKPMATCIKECNEMLKAEKRNGVVMSIIAQNRYRQSIHNLKTLAEGGLAGKIRVAHVNSFWWRGHCYYDLWWRGLWEKEGGGPTLNHAVHHIDMINWIQNQLPNEVTSVLANVMHDNSEVEDLSFAILSYGDGSIASVTSSVVHHGEEQGIELHCEKAKIAAPFDCKASKSLPNGFPEDNPHLVDEINKANDAIPKLVYEGHTGQFDNVLTSLELGQRPQVTGVDGKMAVELITAIYKAGFIKRTIELPIKENDDFYTFDGILKNVKKFYKKANSVEGFENESISLGRY